MSVDGRVDPPHFVFKGSAGGDIEREVDVFKDSETAIFSVQTSERFDERVMLEWIKKRWRHAVVELSVLILDSLKVHKNATVADALASSCTAVPYVPGGCTGVA